MQLRQYEGNIIDAVNCSAEDVQEKLQHLNIYSPQDQLFFTQEYSVH